jgi:hypothetical protein
MDVRRDDRPVERVRADAEALREVRRSVAEVIDHARDVMARSRTLLERLAARRAGRECRRDDPPARP